MDRKTTERSRGRVLRAARMGRRDLCRLVLAMLAVASGLTLSVTPVGPAPEAQAATAPVGTEIRSSQAFWAYVGPGENLDVSFVKTLNREPGATDFPVTVNVRAPGGGSFSCPVIAGDAGAGAVCSLPDLTSATPGIWRIDFLVGADEGPASDVGSDNFGWTIDVQAGAAARPGRVYSQEYVTKAVAPTADLSLWYQSENGFVYRGDYLDYNGIDSVFVSNAVGNVLAGTCTPAYESIDTGGPFTDVSRITPSTGCGAPYKIFFEPPDPAMPATAELYNGSPTWLKPAVQLPDVSNLQFAQDPVAVTRRGQFTFDVIDHQGAATLEIDANNDGDYTDAVDRSITVGVIGDGPVTVPFDGLDGEGDPIAASTPFNARVVIDQAGEIHFMNEDVEVRAGGVRVTKLNGPNTGSQTLYWNDTNLRVAERECTTLVLDGRAGVDSASGVHAWDCTGVSSLGNRNNGRTGSWGDVRSIEDWTYHVIDEQTAVAVAPAPPAPVVFGKQVTGGPTPVAGSPDTYDITYRMTVRNPGIVETEYDLRDELQFGANVAIVAPAPAVANVTPGDLTPLVWDGQGSTLVVDDQAIAPGATHTWEVTARVSFPPTTGVDPANDCVVDDGEDGTGLRNVATLSQPDLTDQVADACRPTGFPNVGKSGVVVEGPNAGSTTTAEAGDVIEWKVQFQNVPDANGDGVTITDAILSGQDYVPGSLDIPGGEWAEQYSTTPGSVDPAVYGPAPEPAGVEGVGMTHPTNGLPTALGGTADFPPPPAPSSTQAGTGGDGYEPTPFGPNVYNIFHHQLGRVYCTVKQTAATCGGYPASGFVIEPLLPIGSAFDGTGGLAGGETVLVVGDTPFVYLDEGNERLWVGGQLVTYTGLAADWTNTGRVGYACVDISSAPVANCGWTETGTGAPTATVQVSPVFNRYFNTSMSSKAAWEQGGLLLGIEYYGGTTTNITRLDVASGSVLSEFPITWPAAGWWATSQGVPGGSVGQDLRITQLGTTTQFIVSMKTETGAIDTVYDVCYDAAANGLCAGWTGPIARPEPYAGTLWASSAVATFDPAMNVTGYCYVWTPHTSVGPSTTPPAITCYTTAGAPVGAPTGWPALFPAGEPGWGLATTYFNFEPGVTVGTRTYYSMTRSTLGAWLDDQIGCYDWSAQAVCGAPFPFDLDSTWAAVPYQLTIDDQIPTCMWELGDTGRLYSFDIHTGGPCTSTVGTLDVDPLDFYCASSEPVITGWDAIVVHNLAPEEFGLATLTLRDANGDPVAGFEDLDVTADIDDDGRIDVSAIPYADATTELSVELRFDGIVAAAFQTPPVPAINLSWVGDPLEMCFRTVVAPVCDVSSIDNLARMVYEPTGEAPRVTTATHAFDHIVTDPSCFELTKTATSRTYLGDGRWEVVYGIDVANTTGAEGRYDLDDELRFGDGIAVVADPPPAAANIVPGAVPIDGTWTGTTPTTRVSSDVSIAPSATHTYQVTVQADVPPTVAAAAADCAAGAGEDGTGFSNTATLQPDSAAPVTATACQEPLFPTIDHTKTLDSIELDPDTGEYVVGYTLTATATGEGLGQYDITDTLRFGPNATVTAGSQEVTAVAPTPAEPIVAGWTGAAPDTLAVDDAPIDAGHTHTYSLTVRAALTGGVINPGQCAIDEDFANTSTLTPAIGEPVDAEACAEPPMATVTQTKALDGAPVYDSSTGLWTIEYVITETAEGEGLGFYSLTDELLYGPNMDVVATTATADNAATPEPSVTWNGETELDVVSGVAIVPGQPHAYRMTVQVRMTGPISGTPGDCGADEDFFNRATLTPVNGDPEVDEACGEPEEPVVSHDKRVLGATFDTATDEWTIEYAIDVLADGIGTGFYDLDDELRFGPNMTIVGDPDVTGPAGTTPSAAWDGTTDTRIVSAQAISGGATQTYLVTVVATVEDPAPGGDCRADEDFYNESTLTTAGQELTDDACLEPTQPALLIDKTAGDVAFDVATDEYVVTYTVTVAATGTGNRAYELLDTLDYPGNLEVTSTEVTSGDATTRDAWDGATDLLVAEDVDITAGETHTYEIEVRATMTAPDAIVNDPAQCTPGSDFVNRAQVQAGTDVLDDDACLERPQPPVTHTKELTDVALDPATGVYTLTYELGVAAGDQPAGQTSYDLADELEFGPNVTVVRAEVADSSPADLALVEAWDGDPDGEPLLVDDQLISTGDDDHSITIEVDLTIDAPVTGNDPVVCAPGVDLHNTATLTAGAQQPATATDCAELPAVTHTKTVVAGPTPVDGEVGQYAITYELVSTETAAGELPAAYDLVDEFRFGPSVRVVGDPAVTTDPDPLPGLQAAWNGDSETLLVDDGVLDPGEAETITLVVVVESLRPDPDPDGEPCSSLDEDVTNTSTLTSNGAELDADACVPLPHPDITHTKTLTALTPNDDGTFTVTYDVVVANDGDGDGEYDLSDELAYGEGVTVVEPAPAVTVVPATVVPAAGWNGADVTELVTDEPIAAAEVHTFTMTVTVSLDAETTTGAATDCSLDDGEAGTGLRNVATLDPGTGAVEAIDCAELPDIDFEKSALDAVPNADGTYTITYELVATNDGAGAGTYDLTDTLTYGAGIVVHSTAVVNSDPGDVPTNEAWNGTDDVVVAADAVLAGGGRHAYAVTVVATPDDDITIGGATDCTLADGEDGTGFRNAATLTAADREISDEACEIVSAIRHDKELTSVTPNGDGTYTAVYEITVTNRAADADTYDLDDRLRYGAGVTVGATEVVNDGPGDVDVNAAWDGTTDTAVAADVVIAGSPDPAEPTVHTYTVTVTLRPDQATTVGAATDCVLGDGEGGTGVLNESTVTTGAGSSTRQACGELPHLTITKTLAGEPTRDQAGVTTVRYTITVTNDGAGDGRYDLTDTLRYGAGIDVRSTSVSNSVPGGIPTNGAWNGRSNTAVARGVDIATGATHTFTASVAAVATSSADARSRDCELGGGEQGTGLSNTAAVTGNGAAQSAEACGVISSSGGPRGPLPTTGQTALDIVIAAALIVSLGAGMLALRRRRTAAPTPPAA